MNIYAFDLRESALGAALRGVYGPSYGRVVFHSMHARYSTLQTWPAAILIVERLLPTAPERPMVFS